MVKDKVRIRFRKDGDLRFVSHHDLMRCFERMLRRAGLPFRSTSGFNPKPRLIFALSLPLGVVGCEEIADLELDAEIAPEETAQKLASAAPAGLSILSVERIDTRAKARVGRVRYRTQVPESEMAGLAARLQLLMQSNQVWIERTRPHRRRVDVRSYLSGIRLVDHVVEMEFFVTPQGTARPDEILRLLDLGELIDNGTVIERVGIALEDGLDQQKLPTERLPQKGVIV
jgi:radical SAM-linked protein